MSNKKVTCIKCNMDFEPSKHLQQCSNCFACTGCEIYTCPFCGAAVEVIPMKKMKTKNAHVKPGNNILD